MNPNKEEEIVELVKRINLSHGGATVQMVTPRLKAMGFQDPGRELRRLKDKGRLSSWETGVYFATQTRYSQGLGKWLI